MSIKCRPDVSDEEIEIVAKAINESLHNSLQDQAARNAAYRALTALRGASFERHRDDLTP